MLMGIFLDVTYAIQYFILQKAVQMLWEDISKVNEDGETLDVNLSVGINKCLCVK